MNPPQPHVNRHGVAGLQTDRYSEESILAFNKEHDAKYGFDHNLKTIYQNVRRFPESCFVEASKCWDKRT